MTPATKQTKDDAGASSASAPAIPEGDEAGPRSAEDEELQLRILFDNAKQAGGAAPPQKHETKGECRWSRRAGWVAGMVGTRTGRGGSREWRREQTDGW